IGKLLFLHELAQNIDVAIRHRIRGENVVIGNDDDLRAIPNAGVLAKFPFENADGSRAANIVRHEDVDVDPYVIARIDALFAGCAREDRFGQSHKSGLSYSGCEGCKGKQGAKVCSSAWGWPPRAVQHI